MAYFKKISILSTLLILSFFWTTTPAAADSSVDTEARGLEGVPPTSYLYSWGCALAGDIQKWDLRFGRGRPCVYPAGRPQGYAPTQKQYLNIYSDNPLQINPKQEDIFVYTVQPGDTLILIALRYNLNMAEIALVNNLLNPNLILPGQQLILPGVTAPTPLPPEPPSPTGNKTHVVQPGETIFSIANLYGVSVGNLIMFNNISNPNVIYVSQTLQIPPDSALTPGPLMPPFEAIEFSKTTIIQGHTLVMKVTLSEGATLSGIFGETPLFFYGNGTGQLWTLIAIHALTEPDIYPIKLVATLPDGREVTQFENITIVEGSYGLENIQVDESRDELLNADLIALEREKMIALWSQVSLRPRWEGPFGYPVAANPPRTTSYFGTRRSYNNSTQLSFHGGADFGGGIGTPIYAPAAGTVALAESLTVRGNAVLIDHGMGLYSGYWHQDQVAVVEGQEIQSGDLIGYMGNTGLVTGPHLHWELRLNGIAVDPLQWVRESIP